MHCMHMSAINRPVLKYSKLFTYVYYSSHLISLLFKLMIPVIIFKLFNIHSSEIYKRPINYIAPKNGIISHYFLISAAKNNKLLAQKMWFQQLQLDLPPCKMWACSEILRMCNSMNIIKLFSQCLLFKL